MRRASRLRAPPLRRSERAWLIKSAAVLTSLALVQLALFGWYLAWAPSDMYRRSKTPDYQLFLLAVWHAASIWMLASNERGAATHERAHRGQPRRLLRWFALASPLAAGMGLISELVRYQAHAIWALLAFVPALVMPVVAYLTFDWLSCLAARARSRGLVVAFRAARLLATIFATLIVAAGAASRQRVAEIVVAAFESLMTLRGAGMACYGGVIAMVLWLAAKMVSAAAAQPIPVRADRVVAARSDRPCPR